MISHKIFGHVKSAVCGFGNMVHRTSQGYEIGNTINTILREYGINKSDIIFFFRERSSDFTVNTLKYHIGVKYHVFSLHLEYF